MKRVYGKGVNDADYVLTKRDIVDGNEKIVWRCPYHALWTSILCRGYSPKFKARRPTYEAVTVCDEWLIFSTFKNWVMAQKCHQEWLTGEKLALDKDILVEGNKIYRPDACVFIPPQINSLLVNYTDGLNGFPAGISWCKERGNFRVQIGVGSDGTKSVGRFDTLEAAMKAALIEKSERILCVLKSYRYKMYADERVVTKLENLASKMKQDAATI